MRKIALVFLILACILSLNAATLNVKTYGAVGDGSAHPLSGVYGSLAAAQAVYPFATSLTQQLDWAASQKAINAATSADCVYWPAGTYLTPLLEINLSMCLDGDGATSILQEISSGADNTIFNIESFGGSTYSFTGTINAGDTSITIASPSGLAMGNLVLLRLGIDPYDPTQDFLAQWVTITSVSGTTVSFTPAITENINGTNSTLYKWADIADTISIHDLAFDYGSMVVPAQLIGLSYTRNVSMNNLTFVKCGLCVLTADTLNTSITNTSITAVNNLYPSGTAIGGWGNVGWVVNTITVAGLSGGVSFLRLESQDRGTTITNADVTLNSDGAGDDLFIIQGGSTGDVITNFTAHSFANTNVLDITDISNISMVNTYLYGQFKSTSGLPNYSGALLYETVLYPSITTSSVTNVPIQANAAPQVISLNSGIYRSVTVHVSSTTGITNFFLLNSGSQGVDLVSNLVSGGDYIYIGQGGTDYPLNELPSKNIQIFTNGSVPGGATVSVTYNYWTTAAAASGSGVSGNLAVKGNVVIH
jgi:hypothetical protein